MIRPDGDPVSTACYGPRANFLFFSFFKRPRAFVYSELGKGEIRCLILIIGTWLASFEASAEFGKRKCSAFQDVRVRSLVNRT